MRGAGGCEATRCAAWQSAAWRGAACALWEACVVFPGTWFGDTRSDYGWFREGSDVAGRFSAGAE